MYWNYNLNEAPKGRHEPRVVHGKDGNTSTYDMFVPEYILACEDGDTMIITKSHWMPDHRRWNGFSERTPPLAWMHYPTHPQKETT